MSLVPVPCTRVFVCLYLLLLLLPYVIVLPLSFRDMDNASPIISSISFFIFSPCWGATVGPRTDDGEPLIFSDDADADADTGIRGYGYR